VSPGRRVPPARANAGGPGVTRRTVAGSATLPLLLLLGLIGAGLVASAPADAASSPPRDDDAAAIAALRRAVQAAAQFGYTGTQVVSTWTPGGTSTCVLEIRQVPGGARTVTVLPTTSGTHSGSTWPMDLAAFSGPMLDALAAAYRLRVVGDSTVASTVAGRPATVVAAFRADRAADAAGQRAARGGEREVARMWLDRDTGLMVRQDVRDADGRLYRMAAFVDFRPTTRVDAVATAAAAVSGSPGWREEDPADLRRWRSAGWPVPPRLGETFRLLDVRQMSAGGPVLHLTYGDGLSVVSVFLQQGRLDAGSLAGFREQRWNGSPVRVADGVPQRVVWQGGRTVITVIADAPPAELPGLLRALPRDDGADAGAMATLRRGLSSLVRWARGG